MKQVKVIIYIVCLIFHITTFCILSEKMATADYTTTVNPGTNWGAWQGWGCSLAWWANQFGTNTNMADALFTMSDPITFSSNVGTYTLPGLGMNVARYNVGGTSISPITIGGNTYTPVNPSSNPPFRMIQNYWLDWGSADPASTSWDWTRDANQRNMMQLAKQRGVNIFQLFSNSPPWWMCYNSSTAGGNNGGDNLQSWNYNQFAIYMATVARYAYDNWGITFESVEPFNEPIADWWKYPCAQEACHCDISTQDAVIYYLRSELNNRGLNGMPIATSDESLYDQALNTWNSLNDTSRAYTYQIDTHGYQYGGGRRDLLYTTAMNAGKGLWNSEYGEDDATGMSLASNLNLDMRWLHPTVWCYWQPFDSGGWGLVQSNPGDNWVGPANPKWFVLAQYTRHIRPGMILIDGGEGNTVAAYDPVEKKLILITTNYNTAQWINYDLSQFATVGGPITRWATSTGGGDMYAKYNDIGLSSKKFQAWFPANTLQTFEIQHVDPVNTDATAPVTTISGVTNDAAYENKVSVTLNAVDDLSGVSNTFYTIDGGATQPYSGGFTVSGAGSHTITYWSADNAGNTESAKSVSFTINPVATVTSLSPSSVTGATTFMLTVNGANFVNGSIIKWNGTNMATTYVSATQITASINKYYTTLPSYPGTATISVLNPDRTRSAGTPISITQPIPIPSIASLSPSTVSGSKSFTLTVNGSNFANGSIIKWNGTNMTTTYVSPAQLTTSINKYYTTLSSYPGSATVSVFNPDGNRSSGATLTITAPLPAISSLSPSSVQGKKTFTLTVNGSNFVSGSIIKWNGTNIATTFVSATQLTASINKYYDTLTSYPGSATISVLNPDGGRSSGATLTITQPITPPTITSLSPSSVTGATSFTLTVNGTGFQSGAVIKWNGTNVTTTYVSPTQLTATINKYYDTLTSYPGSATVSVLNPDSGRSAGASITITTP